MTRPKNFIETDTETFFRDQNFRDQDRYSQKIEKSLDTEKSRDEMSHSDQNILFFVGSHGYNRRTKLLYRLLENLANNIMSGLDIALLDWT